MLTEAQHKAVDKLEARAQVVAQQLRASNLFGPAQYLEDALEELRLVFSEEED